MFKTSAAEREKMGIKTLPANLLDATRELENNDVMRKAFGSHEGRDYIDYFIERKRIEWTTFHEQISKYELDRYLQLF